MNKTIDKAEEMRNKAYDAFWYLVEKEYYNGLSIEIVKVNPKTKRVDKDRSKNTLVQYWLETGLFDKEEGIFEHDYELDDGGDTFEEAIIRLAENVKRLRENK